MVGRTKTRIGLATIAAIVLACFLLIWLKQFQSPTSQARRLVKSGEVFQLDLPMLIAKFGPPNREGYFRDWDHAFILGPEESLFSIDSIWLVVRMGEDEKVREASLLTD